MRKTLQLLFIASVMLAMGCNNNIKESAKELERIKHKWIPDNRVALFDITLIQKPGVLVVKGETTIAEAKKDLLVSLKKTAPAIVDSIIVLPAKELETQWAITTLSVANLRDKPKHEAQLVSQTILGTPLKVLKKEESWSLIQSPDKYIAWTNNASLHFINQRELNQWRKSLRAVITTDTWLNNAKGERISDLLTGSILKLNNINGNKAQITLPDGRTGFINTIYIKEFNTWLENIDLNADQLFDTSKRFMGLPYLWGGTSGKAVDCSGFMKSIYFINGYILARDASQQINYGQAVDLEIEQLKVGDLVFFGRKAPRKVTHVGMYIGDTEYIHASGRVKINSLDTSRDNYNDYRSSTWLGAQRYIGQPSSEGLVSVQEHPWYVQPEINN